MCASSHLRLSETVRVLTKEIAHHERTLQHLACRQQRLMRLGLLLWGVRVVALLLLLLLVRD